MITKMAVVLGVALVLGMTPGCIAIQNARRFQRTAENQGAMPAEYAQPRLGELLTYLSEHGIEVPRQTSVFVLSFWGMYGDLSWEEHPRRPRYEGAIVDIQGTKVAFAVSPAAPWKSEEGEVRKIIKTYAVEDGRPNGAAVVLESKTWMVGYTMEKSDQEMENRLTPMVVAFLNQWTAKD